MTREMIEQIIHLSNVASADNFPGQKQALKDGAWELFKLMMAEGKGDELADDDARFRDYLEDNYDQRNLSRGL
jgi:hypothetical protein